MSLFLTYSDVLIVPILGFIFGGIIGSFLNVIALRLNTGKGVGGRSQCFSCRKTLAWYELIPFVSFIIQKGKCRGCRAAIHPQYFAAEILTGIIFTGLFSAIWHMSLVGFSLISGTHIILTAFFWLIIFALLVIILLYDFRHMIVPDSIVYPVIVLSFVSLFFRGITTAFLPVITNSFSLPSFIQVLAGPLIALPFFIVWLISKGKLFGFGDIKLMVAIGWLLGVWRGIDAVILSFWIAAGVVLVITILQRIGLFQNKKRLIMSTAIPFAPFLVFGLYIILVFGFRILPLPL
jgi:prepilin signal peptidase PulO-like enzyme (type II secretory pathway)